MSEVVRIPFLDGEVLAINENDRTLILLKPIVEELGLDYSGQHAKLRAASWARMEIISMRAPDQDRSRDHTVVDLRTLGTWLVGIKEGKVPSGVRPLLVEMQAKLADHIEKFFDDRHVLPSSSLPSLPEDRRGLAHLVALAGAEVLALQDRVAELAPKAQLHDDWLDDSEEIISLAEAAKDLAQAGLLPSVSSHAHLCRLLLDEKWVTKPGGRYSPAPWTLRGDTIYLTTRWPKSGRVWRDPKTGHEKIRRQTIFLTRAGLAELYRLLIMRRDHPYGVVRPLNADFAPLAVEH